MLATFVVVCCLSATHALPIVDPGLFVIMGVSSCREGSGYCLLGLDCTLDEDFLPDDKGGHCNGLRSAFTPSANFICCRYNSAGDSSSTPLLNATSVILDNHIMDSIPALILSMGSEDNIQESTNSNQVNDDSTEMEYLTTETYKTTTTVAEELSEEESPNEVLQSYSKLKVDKSADNNLASVAVLTNKGIISHFPSVTEINLELIVHDNIHERSVNNDSLLESTAPNDIDVTTLEPSDLCNQDEGCQQDSDTHTSTIQTMDVISESKSVNYKESAFIIQQQNTEETESSSELNPMNLEELTTTEMYSSVANADQALNLESRLAAQAAENFSEQKDFEAVTDPLVFKKSTEIASHEGYIEAGSADTQEQDSNQLQDSIETGTVPSSSNIGLEIKITTAGTTELDLATTEPVRHNEISAEPEDVKIQPSTAVTPTTTTSCSGAGGKNCWLVKFMNGTNIMCLGSFLRNDIILTAANCISRVFDLGLGAVTLQTIGGAVIPRNIIRDLIVHEEYNLKSIQVALNDIGMVRLESALKLTPSICTLCLPNSESDLMDKPCERNAKKYNKKKILEFSGSPMVCQGSTLGGVVSFYNPEPVYTPINDYLPWIRHNMEIINIPLEWQK